MISHLSMLTAVLDGHDDELRAIIASLPVEESPFANVPGTHNGRFTVVRTDPLVRTDPPSLRSGGLPHPMLMCSAVIDSPPAEWLGDLLAVLGTDASRIWSHCAGWPGPEIAVPWLLQHRVKPWLEFATWKADVAEMTRALELRDRVEHFAVSTQGLRADELLARFRSAFPK